MSARLVALAIAAGVAFASCARAPEPGSFATPEDAVRALIEVVKAGDLESLVKFFGNDARDLVSGADPETGRQNQQVFLVATAERWRLEDRAADSKELVVGNEDWPFPIPLVKKNDWWRFDVEAGHEEVLARRIGRNELKAIEMCLGYVTAQGRYAQKPHDGKAPGLYAQHFSSEPGRQDGLYWPATHGQLRSPLGELMAAASAEGPDIGARRQPAPFHGYYYRILTAQGAAAAGGAKDYMTKAGLSGGFALIAWPSQYDSSGIMTFIVNADRVVHERDLGPETPTAVAAITRYDPDTSWQPVTRNTGR